VQGTAPEAACLQRQACSAPGLQRHSHAEACNAAGRPGAGRATGGAPHHLGPHRLGGTGLAKRLWWVAAGAWFATQWPQPALRGRAARRLQPAAERVRTDTSLHRTAITGQRPVHCRRVATSKLGGGALAPTSQCARGCPNTLGDKFHLAAGARQRRWPSARHPARSALTRRASRTHATAGMRSQCAAARCATRCHPACRTHAATVMTRSSARAITPCRSWAQSASGARACGAPCAAVRRPALRNSAGDGGEVSGMKWSGCVCKALSRQGRASARTWSFELDSFASAYFTEASALQHRPAS